MRRTNHGKEKEGNIANKEQNKTLTIMIALLIVVIWFAVFIFLIKSDVGGSDRSFKANPKGCSGAKFNFAKATEEQIAEENNIIILLSLKPYFEFKNWKPC